MSGAVLHKVKTLQPWRAASRPRERRPRSQEAEQRYFVCFAPYHFDAQGRTLPHMPLIIINLYNNEYNINILFMYIYYYIMCAYYVADVATPVFFRIGCLFLSSAHHISPRGLTANSGCRQWLMA